MQKTLIIFATLGLFAGYALAGSFQERASIQAAAEEFMLEKTRAEYSRHADVRAGHLDSRLRLAECDVPLQAVLRAGGRTLGNDTVGVRCAGSKTWSRYVPVKISVREQVVVAARPLPKGAVLENQDLKLVEADISELRSGYYSDIGQVIGKQLRRNMKIGSEIIMNGVKDPLQVKRGQAINLVAQIGGLRVQMKGKALADGSAGERIRVRNLSSKRVVEGVISSPTTVMVIM